MKIGILTHYDVNNQGAQLQMYALYKKIEELNHQAVVLTYKKNYDFDESKKKIYQPSLKSIPAYMKEYLFKRGLGSTIHNYLKLKKNKEFRKEFMKFDNYATAPIDAAVVGSDEVFSIPMGVNMMMYGHCVNTDNVFSYAPSFGQTDIKLLEEHHAKELVASGLKKFTMLSARDQNTKIIIQELTGRGVIDVCDPVLLYDFSNTKVNFKKVPKKKYLLVYAYDYNMTDEKEVEVIKQFAKENGLITVSAGTYHKWCDCNITCNALEWIEVFRNAEFVVTDTFHGTIVSAIAEAPMAVMIRSKLNSNKLNDLVMKIGIENRKIDSVCIEELRRVFSEKLEKEVIRNNIEKYRQESETFLKEAINKCSLNIN